MAQLDRQPVEHPVVDGVPSLLVVRIAAALPAALVGPLGHDDGVDEGLAADFSGVYEYRLVLFLHLGQLALLVVVDELDVLVQRLYLPLLVELALLDVQELDEELGAVLDGEDDEAFDEADESPGAVAVLAEDKGDFGKFLEDGPGPDDAVVEEHLFDGGLRDYEVLVEGLLLQLLLDVDVEPVADGLPEVLFVNAAAVEAAEEDPALLEVVDVVLDVLADGLERVAVDDGDVEDDPVLLHLEVVAELLHAPLVLVEPEVDAEELVVLLVVLAHEQRVHDADPGQLAEVPQVHQHVQERAHADVVLGVPDARHDLLGELSELRENGLVPLEDVADVVHLGEEHYFFVEAEVVLVLAVGEAAHELHAGELVDAVAVPAEPALEVGDVVVALGRPRQHPVAVLRPLLPLRIFGQAAAEGVISPAGEAAAAIFISDGGYCVYNAARKSK